MVNAFTAIDRTLSLTKGQGYLRGRLHDISKAEENGTRGATNERLTVTAKLQRDITAAQRAIEDTRAASVRYQRAANILRGGHPTSDTLHQRCADLVRMSDAQNENSIIGLADQLDQIAKRAHDAAEWAADRLAKHDIDMKATAALAAYLAKLAERNFKSDKQTERLRQSYLAFKRAAA